MTKRLSIFLFPRLSLGEAEYLSRAFKPLLSKNAKEVNFLLEKDWCSSSIRNKHVLWTFTQKEWSSSLILAKSKIDLSPTLLTLVLVRDQRY